MIKSIEPRDDYGYKPISKELKNKTLEQLKKESLSPENIKAVRGY